MSSERMTLSPVVVFALQQFIGERTLVPCKGRLRSKDRPIVAGVLYYLTQHGETFTWIALREWALAEVGASTEFADELGGLADDVLAGQWDERPRLILKADAINRWRAESARSVEGVDGSAPDDDVEEP